MNKTSQGKSARPKTEWDEAIEDYEARIKRLKEAIGSFKAHRDAGIAWPGTQSNDHDSGQQHAV